MAGKTMRALQYDCYGGGADALKFVEIPIPSPKRFEVLIRVEAASLNACDWKLQEGVGRPFLPLKFPFIPATDVAGEVIEVGSEVKAFKAGDKVISMVESLKGGGLAEYAVAPASITVIRPPAVSAAEGSGLAVACCTAYQALKLVGTKFDGTDKPSNILITAASGGVGHYAVQLAKLGNFHVTATCGARNMEFIKTLGADEVLDYKTPEGALLKSPSGRKYDLVMHCASSIDWSVFEPNLSENGIVIDVTPTVRSALSYYLKKLSFPKKQLVPMMLSPKGEDLKCMVELLKERKIKTVVDTLCPFKKAKEAWTRMMEGHATGKIVIEM